VQIIKTDVAIVGAGGSGLRAAIEIAEKHPDLDIALISKVYPMRSHTVAAEGGAAGVIGVVLGIANLMVLLMSELLAE